MKFVVHEVHMAHPGIHDYINRMWLGKGGNAKTAPEWKALLTRVGHTTLMDYEFHFIRGNIIIHRNNKIRKFLELYN